MEKAIAVAHLIPVYKTWSLADVKQWSSIVGISCIQFPVIREHQMSAVSGDYGIHVFMHHRLIGAVYSNSLEQRWSIGTCWFFYFVKAPGVFIFGLPLQNNLSLASGRAGGDLEEEVWCRLTAARELMWGRWKCAECPAVLCGFGMNRILTSVSVPCQCWTQLRCACLCIESSDSLRLQMRIPKPRAVPCHLCSSSQALPQL